jgi:hypothetical protein
MAVKASIILVLLEEKVAPGTVIPKPQAHADFVVKGWGKRRGERALIFSIPNHSKPSTPHEIGVTSSEWEKAFEYLMSSGEFSRKWFDRYLTACAKEGSCNFTTIGGIFELLGHAKYYDRGVYRLIS